MVPEQTAVPACVDPAAKEIAVRQVIVRMSRLTITPSPCCLQRFIFCAPSALKSTCKLDCLDEGGACLPPFWGLAYHFYGLSANPRGKARPVQDRFGSVIISLRA